MSDLIYQFSEPLVFGVQYSSHQGMFLYTVPLQSCKNYLTTACQNIVPLHQCISPRILVDMYSQENSKTKSQFGEVNAQNLSKI